MHVEIPTQQAWEGAPRFVLTGAWAARFPAVEPGTPTSSGVPIVYPSRRPCGCGLGSLGAAVATLTPAQALQMAIAAGSNLNLNPRDINNPTWLADAQAAIAAGAIPVTPPFGPNCAGMQTSNMSLLTTASGITLSAAGATTGILVATHVISAVTGAIAGAATLGVGALISVVAMIFAHHAAAVKRDLAFGCSALPAVNNAFAVLAQAVAAKQTTPAAAAQALDTVYSNYQSAGGSAINTSPFCNSNCELGVVLKGMVLYWQAKYNAMAAAQAAPAAVARPSTGATPSAVAPTGQPAGTLVQTGAPAAAAAAAAPVSGGFPWILALLGAGAVWALT